MISLDSTGIETQTLQEILDEAGQSAKDQTGRQDLDVTPGTSAVGDTNMVWAKREYDLCQTIRSIYASTTINGATGQQATDLALLTGTVRPLATTSSVILTLNLDPGAIVIAGSLFRVPNDQYTWATTLEVENTGLVAANFTVGALASETGAVRANAGTITESVVNITGLNSCTNVLAAVQGRGAYSDQELMNLRAQELQASGFGPQQAIDAALRGVTNVLDCKVPDLEDGLTHSYVWDNLLADNDEIAQAIYNKKGYGVPSTGAFTGTAKDYYGSNVTVSFDRVTGITIYFRVQIKINADLFPLDGDQQIKDAIVALAASDERFRLSIGQDVISSRFVPSVYGVTGVLEVVNCFIGLAPSPSTTATIAISDVQIGLVTAGNIVVEHV